MEWDKMGERFYETGCDHGVLYLEDSPENLLLRRANKNLKARSIVSGYNWGTPWSGLTAVNDNPSGAESNSHYADNIKYLTLISAEDLNFTIEAFTYPEAYELCQGRKNIAPGVVAAQQERMMFGFSYRTKIGNDTESDSLGYKLHLRYGCMASPSSRNYGTLNDTPEPINFSWEVSTTPVDFPGFKPTAGIDIDTRFVEPDKLTTIENILYGVSADGTKSGVSARLPLPSEIYDILTATSEISEAVTARSR